MCRLWISDLFVLNRKMLSTDNVLHVNSIAVFVEIYHEIISTGILLPSRRVVVSYKRVSMFMNYWFTARSSLPRKKCG